ncbi:MAG: hypothetical protein MHM6MM_000120 [Cercozoa sp. M6MM]
MSERVQRVVQQVAPNATKNESEQKEGTLSIIDERTGRKYTVAVKNGTIRAKDLAQIKMNPSDAVGLRSYDPGYVNTASATSRITYIDGANGVLTYRGYPIEQLAEKSTFLEVAFLLVYGELPTQQQFAYFKQRVMKHTFIHSDLSDMMKSFRYDAHPMGMLASTVSAMGVLHPEANPALQGQDVYDDKRVRNKQIHRILGTMPTMAAHCYRHRIGREYVPPSSANLSYTENFLYMLDRLSNVNYRPHPVLAKALDVLFILHADHELNCSTAAMRHATSSGVDVYSAVASSVNALYGPRHGGANEAVLRMLERIGTKDNVPAFVERVKQRKERLMGFGHRVYKNYDPRARIVRKVAAEVFSVLGKEPLIELAQELEKVALSDPYFKKRKLYPNVDFYSGVIYKCLGFPTDFFPVLFAIPRTAGWLAHWNEFLDDPENRIVRPRQVYVGAAPRDYVPMSRRTRADVEDGLTSYVSAESKRRSAAPERP